MCVCVHPFMCSIHTSSYLQVFHLHRWLRGGRGKVNDKGLNSNWGRPEDYKPNKNIPLPPKKFDK